jgi:DNA-binding cell septation regulator SpoVG
MATKESTETKPELSFEEEMDMIRNAPIEDVAKYFKGDLNMAVQLRVDTAVEDTYDKVTARQGVIAEDIYRKWSAELAQNEMDITVRPIEQRDNLYGFASVTIGGIKVDDFKIVTNKEGELFVGMPSKKDPKSKTGYRNTVSVDNDTRDDFNAAVIEKYHEAVEKAQTRAANLKSVPDKQPERMADQLANAKKQADKHNAQLPAKEKGEKVQSGRE